MIRSRNRNDVKVQKKDYHWIVIVAAVIVAIFLILISNALVHGAGS